MRAVSAENWRLRRARRQVIIALVALVIGFNGLIAAAAPGSPFAVSRDSSVYCGVYAMYAALRQCGVNVSLADLVSSKYISSEQGSSLGDLKQIADDYGLPSAFFRNLRHTDLLKCDLAILHVKRNSGSDRYDHWVLYVKDASETAILLDYPQPPRRVAMNELSSFWNGGALVVATDESQLGAVGRSLKLRYASYAAVMLGTVLGARWLLAHYVCGPRPSGLRRRVTLGASQTLVVLSVGALIACIQFVLPDAGGLRSATARAGIAEKHAASFLPSISASRLRDIEDKVIIIDTRLRRDFLKAHIPGAVSVPIDGSEQERGKALAGVPKDQQIIVYCQSRTCPYAHQMAKRLLQMGYTNLWILRGGWNEWMETHGLRKPREGE